MVRRRIPSYRHYKPKNLGLVVIEGRSYYLGKYGTPESLAEYNRLIQEWLANQQVPPAPGKGREPTVSEILLAFWQHAQEHYRTPQGTPTGELENLRDALRPLRKLYGHTLARDFGPLALRTLQQELVKAGLARTTVNARVNRVRRVFRWAVSLELVPPAVYQALQAVPGLQRGRCNAPEPEKVAPVSFEHVEATLPLLPAPVAAMARLQLLSGCRAGEAMVLRACDLDRSGPVWTYRPHRHKNQHREGERVIFLGPQAQELLLPLLRVTCPCCGLTDRPHRLAWRSGLCGPCADRHDELGVCGPWPRIEPPGDYYLFSPREYVEDLHSRRAAQRVSKRTPSELARKRKAAPKRKPAERYTRRSYRLAVVRACEKAGVPPWSPLQLRHTAATAIRARYGVEAAKAILGHTRVETSQIYAERDLARAAQIMAEVG